jgi:hypothetical protein
MQQEVVVSFELDFVLVVKKTKFIIFWANMLDINVEPVSKSAQVPFLEFFVTICAIYLIIDEGEN